MRRCCSPSAAAARSCRRRRRCRPRSPRVTTDELAYADRIRGASIYPAVQNIVLACRALGLGTVITTNHIRCEAEVKALLGIPDDVATCALMPIGWPLDPFGPLTRRPVAEVAYAERWGSAWPG
jgi:nitroreductase